MRISEVLPIPEEVFRPTLRFSVLARDMATLGTGMALAAVFGTLLVFFIPRLVSVEDFGYWRLFLLYAGYVGFLHFGLADGSLLRWAGRPLADFHHEIRPLLKFLLAQHLVILFPALVVAWILPSPSAQLIAIGVLLFSVIYNLAAVLQFSLQASRQFVPAAIATAAPSGGLLLLTFLCRARKNPDFRVLIILYFVAWLSVLTFLWLRVKPWRQPTAGASAWAIGRGYIAIGWPIMLANTCCGLAQSADRLVVSSALPIRDFALYSLAASTMFVPVTAIAAISRVLFPHFAGIKRENHARTYGRTSKFLVLAWTLLLPYYFVLEAIVGHFLPKYIPSLPIARLLLLGVFFFAGIQILHLNFFNLYGRQHKFFVHSAAALILSIFLAVLAATWVRSLSAVAAAQVGAAGLWWQFNEWRLREITGWQWKNWLQIFLLFGWSAASLWITVTTTQNLALRLGVYYALVSIPLMLAYLREIRFYYGIVMLRLHDFHGQREDT